MAVIKISELRPTGSELFQDSESFLNELTSVQEVGKVIGGWSYNYVNSVQSNVGNTHNANTFNNANTIVGNYTF
ncbi:MAG: hypothetical protein DSM106950_24405 [Stigonema ocellatum SAG 48.90 = DSM 106950]|nr:hypothetical protein [Stigonema ocellatum SAG 48.90 = DSM 106950]